MAASYSERDLDKNVSDLKITDKPFRPVERVLPRTLSAYSGAMQNMGCYIGASIFLLQANTYLL
jgi:hypothetical protein